MSTPSAKEINPYNCLDGNIAEKHFLGKTVEDAVDMLSESFESYQEDLMFMGHKAFEYYWEAINTYVRSEKSSQDWPVINYLKSVIYFQIEEKEIQTSPIIKQVKELVEYVLDNFDKFNDINENVMGEDDRERQSAILKEWAKLHTLLDTM